MWKMALRLLALVALYALAFAFVVALLGQAAQAKTCEDVPYADRGECELRERLHEQALRCPWLSKKRRALPVVRQRIRRLLEIEYEEGLPQVARGLLAAAACRESGYKPRARGDRGDVSWGLLQFRVWALPGIRRAQDSLGRRPSGDPRYDWEASAVYWVRHVKAQVPSIRKRCRYLPYHWRRWYLGSREARVWAAAHAKAIRRSHKCVKRVGKRCVKRVKINRCFNVSKHWKRMARWQRNVRRQLEAFED